MKRALREFRIEPVKTTIPLHIRILDDPLFQKGEFTTHFIERFLPGEDEEEDEEE
jgi:acetyl-CoA carboxylase biotin carboxylase subunit